MKGQVFGKFNLSVIILMNFNIIAVTFSYLSIKDISDKFEILNNESMKEVIIYYLANMYQTNFFNIKAKINNFQLRCGKCNKNLIGDYSVKFGYKDCLICNEKVGFNIDLCNNCTNMDFKRGEIRKKLCPGNHTEVYFGINILSY